MEAQPPPLSIFVVSFIPGIFKHVHKCVRLLPTGVVLYHHSEILDEYVLQAANL